MLVNAITASGVHLIYNNTSLALSKRLDYFILKHVIILSCVMILSAAHKKCPVEKRKLEVYFGNRSIFGATSQPTGSRGVSCE